MLLHPGSERVWHAMEVDALLAERFTMVRDIEERAIDLLRGLTKHADLTRQHTIGVRDRIVVGVHHLLSRTLMESIGTTCGFESPELRWIALRVSGTVAANLMEDNDRVALDLAKTRRKVGQHDFVVAVRIDARR